MTLAFPFLVVLRNRVKVTQHTLIKKKRNSYLYVFGLCCLNLHDWIFGGVSFFSDVWQLTLQSADLLLLALH